MVKYKLEVIQQIGSMLDAIEVKGRVNHQLIVNILNLLQQGEQDKEMVSDKEVSHG